jgi:hypothetical protein
MSTQWRCATCEAVNDGGETCVACGAKVTQTVIQSTPAEETSAPEIRVREESATEIPVRELPRRKPESDRPDDGPYDIYDFFDMAPTAETDATYDSYERIDTRPRVRVYGCCLPIALGMLIAFLGAITLLGNLVIGAL